MRSTFFSYIHGKLNFNSVMLNLGFIKFKYLVVLFLTITALTGIAQENPSATIRAFPHGGEITSGATTDKDEITFNIYLSIGSSEAVTSNFTVGGLTVSGGVLSDFAYNSPYNYYEVQQSSCSTEQLFRVWCYYNRDTDSSVSLVLPWAKYVNKRDAHELLAPAVWHPGAVLDLSPVALLLGKLPNGDLRVGVPDHVLLRYPAVLRDQHNDAHDPAYVVEVEADVVAVLRHRVLVVVGLERANK